MNLNAVLNLTLLLWRRCPEGADEVPFLSRHLQRFNHVT
jgi:hypothetical protein